MPSKHIFSLNVDFSQRELLNAALQNLFQPPLVPVEGQIYYDSFYNVAHYWNETEWVPLERPVHKSYSAQNLMIADQQYQLKNFIYHDGSLYWEYLGTVIGDITDYRLFGGGTGSSYVHPTYTPYDLTLSGATVIQNIETDSIGSVVNLTVRELNLSDLGYSGVTNADYYGNWILNVNGSQFYIVESENVVNIQAGNNITLDTSGNTITISSQDTIYVHPSYTELNLTLTGSTVISEITTDDIGSVVDIQTREITLSDLGYSGDTNADYYGNWILNINGIQTYVIESEDILNLQEGDNITLDISGNTITISSQDTIYTHPIYTPINLSLTGSTVLSTIVTDDIGSVLSATTRTLTPSDIGAEPEFLKGNIIIPVDSGLAYTGDTENRLVDSGNLTIINDDKGSDQNIFKEIKDENNNIVISATTNNDFIQIEGQSGTTVSFESNNKIIISSSEQNNYVRTYEIPSTEFNFDNPIIPQLVSYVNGLTTPITITETDSKLNIIINGENCNIIIELINRGKGLYGVGYTLINENDLLIIKDNCNLCCDNIVKVLYIPCNSIDIALPLKPQISAYINQLNPPLIIKENESKYNIIIDCEEPGESIPCESGMDVLFLLDYTGSMDTNITAIKNSITDITNTIITKSGGNYRLALALFDEYNGSTTPPNYSGSDFYQSLLANGQVYINSYINGNISKIQYITIIEDFSYQNISGFTENIGKINKTSDPIPGNIFLLGNGAGAPEPYDIALDICINGTPFTGTTRTEFLKPFRENVNKQIIIITDQYPSGVNDLYDQNDINFINGTLKNSVLDNNINLSLSVNFYLSSLFNEPNINTTGISYYSNTFIFDGFSRTFTLTERIFSKLSIRINSATTNLTQTKFIVDFDSNSFTIKDEVILTSGDEIKVYYRSNAILNIVNESGGLFSRDYSPEAISSTIENICSTTTEPINIYEIIGAGLGNTEINSCVNYNPTLKLYTFCENIGIGCKLYFDEFGNSQVTGHAFVSINNIVYQLSSTGEILSISTLNCNDIITTYLYTGSGYGSTSQNACDDAISNNRNIYSDCEVIASGCTIYDDTYGLNPLTGYTQILIEDVVWDITSFDGVLLGVSGTQCASSIIYTFTNTGYGNTEQDACDDKTLNGRVLYSDCSTISTGCEIYTDVNGTILLTGVTYVLISNRVWDINSTTGVIIELSDIQCEVGELNSYGNSGYGETESDACNDSINVNRILYSDCTFIDVGCIIYTDINGNTELTTFNYVFIGGSVWNINSSTGQITSYSIIQC